jgi:hypothetical protein
LGSNWAFFHFVLTQHLHFCQNAPWGEWENQGRPEMSSLARRSLGEAAPEKSEKAKTTKGKSGL